MARSISARLPLRRVCSTWCDRYSKGPTKKKKKIHVENGITILRSHDSFITFIQHDMSGGWGKQNIHFLLFELVIYLLRWSLVLIMGVKPKVDGVGRRLFCCFPFLRRLVAHCLF